MLAPITSSSKEAVYICPHRCKSEAMTYDSLKRHNRNIHRETTSDITHFLKRDEQTTDTGSPSKQRKLNAGNAMSSKPMSHINILSPAWGRRASYFEKTKITASTVNCLKKNRNILNVLPQTVPDINRSSRGKESEKKKSEHIKAKERQSPNKVKEDWIEN